jgi:hypothetical protein
MQSTEAQPKTVLKGSGKPFEGSGKSAHLVNPPIVSMSPVSKSDNEGGKPKIINDAADILLSDEEIGKQQYPFHDLEVGQGFFVPTGENMTTDNMMEKLYTAVFNARSQYAQVARDEHGDEILEQLTIKTRKRNDDGTIQLDGADVPIPGANFVHKPKLIHYRDFIVKPVAKNDPTGKSGKAEADGVLVIRVL